MKWSEKTWEQTLPVYNRIIELPFIKELITGELDKEKFHFYIKQDAIYIAEYGKILTAIASRLEKIKDIEAFMHFAADSIAVEKALHESYLKTDEPSHNEASPCCLLYTSYLHKQLATAPVEVALAAVLPCFWIYKEVGDFILLNQTKSENPYQEWINTYGGEDFAESVATAISICDEYALNCTEKQQKIMTQAFITCSRMEWMFWNSAWELEKWPV